MEILTTEHIIEELEAVIDPELGIDIVNLGLIYDITFSEPDSLKVTMTMTSMGCPMAGHIIAEVKETLLINLPVLKNVDVEIVWTPVWSKERMSRFAKIALGIHG